MSIEFTTTEDLIKELQNRETFVGIIIRSKKEHKCIGKKLKHNTFEIFDKTGGNLEKLLKLILNEIQKENYN